MVLADRNRLVESLMESRSETFGSCLATVGMTSGDPWRNDRVPGFRPSPERMARPTIPG